MQTGTTSMLPVARTLQERLDEKVSVKSFGASGDGSDQTVVMQRAIDQLYLNSATKGSTASRVTLEIPAGEYLLSASLKLPPYATIVGAGQDKVKITDSVNMTGRYELHKVEMHLYLKLLIQVQHQEVMHKTVQAQHLIKHRKFY